MSTNTHDPLSVMLTAKDAKKSIAFYRDVLGFQLEHAWPDESKPLWASLLLGRQSIMIGADMPPAAIDGMCSSDPAKAATMKARHEELQKNRPGAGVFVYVQVDDVDAHHARAKSKGAKGMTAPQSQFYGIREYEVEDPDGYRLMIYTPITMASCQSCGMPMKDAAKGAMYCGYCTDEKGKLKAYDVVLQGTVEGYFVGMKGMKRPEAEKAAREHLSKMPAWQGRK